ncbi:MAG: hypothetical protein ABI947_30015 [Chloroflexota bacterium]
MTDTPVRSIEDTVTDFLSAAPTLQEIAAYRLPDVLQDRAHELLNKNRSGNLTDEERIEMEQFRQIDHLLTLVKAKARLNLQKQV